MTEAIPPGVGTVTVSIGGGGGSRKAERCGAEHGSSRDRHSVKGRLREAEVMRIF